MEIEETLTPNDTNIKFLTEELNKETKEYGVAELFLELPVKVSLPRETVGLITERLCRSNTTITTLVSQTAYAAAVVAPIELIWDAAGFASHKVGLDCTQATMLRNASRVEA